MDKSMRWPCLVMVVCALVVVVGLALLATGVL